MSDLTEERNPTTVKRYRIIVVASLLAIGGAIAAPSRAQSIQDQTVQTATNVLNEIMQVPTSSIPQALLADAQGLAIVPGVIKGGFVVGVRFGRGVVLVRDEQGAWRPPAFISLTGGSVGWQAGLQATDVILVFRTAKSVQGLMNGKFTIGADAAAAAGPVGRQASAATDAQLRAEILSYSRSRGLFAGVSLEGSVLQVDQAATQAFYQTANQVPDAAGNAAPALLPPSAVRLMETVAQHTSRTPAAPAATPAPGTVPPGFATPASAPSEAELRGQLAAASQRLQLLLDDHWKRFLALPPGIQEGANPPDVESLRQALSRFDTVAQDPQFAALTGRQEFQTAYQQLRNYLNARTAAQSPLNLPPPPR
ncbi:MAG: lipid-binding SYLF domain-containing protein [Pirellulaceae bacterium]|nr:lipid-binding SYLF domain-containing protein [Pirellulaceae bacterium]